MRHLEQFHSKFLLFFSISFCKTQNHAEEYPVWQSTTIADNSRPHGDSAPASCLAEPHNCTPPPLDHGCLPEESASPARCFGVNLLIQMKNVPEYTDTLQYIDPVSNADISQIKFK